MGLMCADASADTDFNEPEIGGAGHTAAYVFGAFRFFTLFYFHIKENVYLIDLEVRNRYDRQHRHHDFHFIQVDRTIVICAAFLVAECRCLQLSFAVKPHFPDEIRRGVCKQCACVCCRR